METAKELNVPLPTTSVVHSLFNAMLAAGWGDLDHSAVIKVIESLAQVEARTDEE
jgi:2-hydroxy-3-oxopropionate reductase